MPDSLTPALSPDPWNEYPLFCARCKRQRVPPETVCPCGAATYEKAASPTPVLSPEAEAFYLAYCLRYTPAERDGMRIRLAALLSAERGRTWEAAARFVEARAQWIAEREVREALMDEVRALRERGRGESQPE